MHEVYNQAINLKYGTWESGDEGVITAVDVVIHDSRKILYADQTAKRLPFCPHQLATALCQ